MSADLTAGRAALANVLLFGHVVGGVDKPTEPEPAADPRPKRPAGSADQGMRGTIWPDSPREMFARALQRGLGQ